MANRQNTLLLKRSNVIGKIPPISGLTLGEMALNTADAKLYSLYTSGTVSPTEVRQIGWDRIARTGDTVTGDFNFFGDISISGSSTPNGYALSVTGDTSLQSLTATTTNINGNLTVTGDTNLQSLTANTIYTNYIDFNNNLSPIPANLEGRVFWDDDNGSLSLGMHGSQVSQQIGLEQYYYIRNQSGATIENGKVVRSAGTLGNSGKILGEYMISDGTIPYYFTLGIATEDILNGEDGYVTEFGLVRGINTTGSLYGETWVDGTILYVSPTILGGLTSVEPIEPNLKIQIAIVVNSANNGSLFVRPSLGYNLGDLHNVQTSGQTNGDLISYNSSQGYWEYTKTLNGNYTISGNTNQIGNFNITGNTTQSGSTTQVGNYNVTGNTNQLGYNYIVSATTGCTLAVTGTTCLTGPVNITGPTFMSGNFCMNNMNTGQTGTNCFDTSLIPTGSTIIHQFQSEGGVLAHLGDLASGEPNSRGYTYFENNTVLTSFVAVGTGVYTPVIGAPQTVAGYANLFIVTTGATTATTNKLTYNYPSASGTSFTFLKFTVSLSVEVAQNQQLTFQIRRTRGVSVTTIPIGMSITPNGNTANGISFNGIAEALDQDEFVLVVRNATGSGASNSVRITDLSFSMFT